MHDEMSLSIRAFKHLIMSLGPDELLEPYTEDVMAEVLKVRHTEEYDLIR